VERHRRQDGGLDARRHVGVEPAGAGERIGQQEAVLGGVRRPAGHEVVQRRADGVQIGPDVRVAGVAGVLLERRVGQRTDAARHGERPGVGRVHRLDEAEVDQLDPFPRDELDVRRLDVAVQHGRRLGVQVGDGIEELIGPAEHPLDVEELARGQRCIDDLAKVGPVDVVHDQEVRTVVLEIVGDLGQGRMVEARQHAGLAVELGLAIGPVGRRADVRQDRLDGGDAAGQTQVVRTPDRTGTALTDEFDQTVAVAKYDVGLEVTHAGRVGRWRSAGQARATRRSARSAAADAAPRSCYSRRGRAPWQKKGR